MKKKNIFILSISIILIFSLFISVYAVSYYEEINAIINKNLKMVIDNIEWTPMDIDGSPLRPITYKGRTYLPVRALSEKYDIAIDYDAENQTVLIGNKEWTPYIHEMMFVSCNDFIGYTYDKDLLDCAKNNFNDGFVYDENVLNFYSETTLLLGRRFQTMKFKIAYDKGKNKQDSVTVYVKEDSKYGAILKSVTVKSGEMLEVECDVKAANKIFICKDKSEDYTGKLVIGEIYFK